MSKASNYIILALLSLTLLSPFLALFPQISFAFFQDYLLATLSISVTILVLYLVNSNKPGVLSYSILDILVIVFLIYNLFNLYTLNTIEFKRGSIYILLQLFFYLGLKHFFLREAKANFHKCFIVTLLVINIIPVLIAIFELIGIIPIFGQEFIMTGGFLNQGQFANFLAIIFPIPLAVVVFDKDLSRFLKISALIISILTFALILISLARSAWISSFVSIAFLMMCHQKTTTFLTSFLKSRIKKFLFVSSFLVIGIITVGGIYNMKKESANGRIFIWENCIRMVKDKPLFGHGYDSFCNTYNHYQISYFNENPHNTPQGSLAYEAVFAFNDYLETWVETGIIGIALFLGYIAFALFSKQPEDLDKSNSHYLLPAVKSVILAILCCSMFSYPLQHPTFILLLLAILAYISGNYSHPAFRICIRRKLRILITILGFVFVSFLFVNQIKFFQNLRQWKTCYEKAQTVEVRDAMVSYKDLAPYFKDYWPFLFNYGSSLQKVKEYKEGIRVLELAELQNVTYDLLINLGVYYEAISQTANAERCYRNASNLIPHKLTPNFYLFKLYQKTNQPEKAHDIAQLITNTELKVYSEMGARMKYEVSKYLEDSD